MKMQKWRVQIWSEKRLVVGLILLLGFIVSLVTYRLGSIPAGLSAGEIKAINDPVGWHGIYHQFFYLPLNIVRSLVFFVFPNHGQLLGRLPNVLFGLLAVLSFACLVRLWHGTRTAFLATLLFSCSAWVLHVSRLASFDVLYLLTVPTMLLTLVLLKKYLNNAVVWYGSLLIWGLLLYVPGLIWLLIAAAITQYRQLLEGWRYFNTWRQKSLSVAAVVVWLPLLFLQLTRPGSFMKWLGFPEHMAGGSVLLKQFVAVPVHLFASGPQYPELWLARLPILDIFTLVVCLLGIYFYATHWQASRSRTLGLFLGIGSVLVGLGGAVPISLLVPLLYLSAATGIAYLTHEWLRVFPHNPLARSLGIGLVVVVVGLSCVYNTRSYFVAWANNSQTRASFHYHQ